MFWHEEKENDNHLINYTKLDYLKIVNPKLMDLIDDSRKNGNKNILDLSDNFKVDMTVPNDWGQGKVVSIDSFEKKVVLRIEGQEKTFDMFELHPYLLVYLHVYFKNMELQDKKVTINGNIFLDDTIGELKKKIADVFKADKEKVILVHNGGKLTNDNKKILELELYYQDNILVIINGLCDY